MNASQSESPSAVTIGPGLVDVEYVDQLAPATAAGALAVVASSTHSAHLDVSALHAIARQSDPKEVHADLQSPNETPSLE